MYLFITVDAEAVHGCSDPWNEFMWGRLPGIKGEYGVSLIADICEHYGFKVTYFLDVYEHTYYGIDKVKEVAQYLENRGHDVQLHTHPAWYQDPRDNKSIQKMKAERSCFPPTKYWMNLNTLEEQINILKHGKNLLEDWLGKSVLAHRAGAYAINLDTIKALKETGFKLDSSTHFCHPNCHLSLSINQAVYFNDILEIPITGYFLERIWDGFIFKYKHPLKFVATDVNGSTAEQIIHFADMANSYDVKVINLFMHSYSFVKYNHNFTKLSVDDNCIEKLHRILKALTIKKCKSVTSQDLIDIHRKKASDITGEIWLDGAPRQQIEFNIYKLFLEKYLVNRRISLSKQ